MLFCKVKICLNFYTYFHNLLNYLNLALHKFQYLCYLGDIIVTVNVCAQRDWPFSVDKNSVHKINEK